MKRIITIILALLSVTASFIGCGSQPSNNISVDETSGDIETSHEAVNTPNEVTMLPAAEIRIMSMNMSYDVEHMRERSDIAIPLILSYSPDSMGTQENGGRPDWPYYLEKGLPDYKFVGRFSNGNLTCSDHYMVDRYLGYYVYNSANYIYYNAKKYNCLDWDTIWLSETPHFKSQYKGGLLRTCTWAIFENKENGFRYAHVNCHLGYDTDELNMFQMKLVRGVAERFANLGLPVFITGDFNTREGGSSYQIMTSSPIIFDSKFLAESKKNAQGTPIDFIFVSDAIESVHEYEVIYTDIDGYELSDHNWVFARATVSSLPDSYKTPADVSNSGISVIESDARVYACDLKFTQAVDIYLLDSYYIELFDNTGKLILEKKIPTRHLDADTAKVKNCSLHPLSPNTEYTVKIYAKNLIGTMSEPVVYSFTTAVD
ncbi:MAG: hypothetical protein E7627_06915 [Ruminococcaceae bacterium]|nr:hypothetical protein [Oscillospiraceae bacterium]